ncbi:hypothetical protein BGX26_006208 [Mortierella sp. AD094]|nr:hypothetical protein BGX26_006208 [Mortierella sp. AD094]
MTRIKHVLACLTILSLILKIAYASFGFCVALNTPRGFGRQVVGFKLWDDHGEEAQEYRTLILAKKTTLQYDKWILNLKFSDGDKFILDEVAIISEKYGDMGVAIERIKLDTVGLALI